MERRKSKWIDSHRMNAAGKLVPSLNIPYGDKSAPVSGIYFIRDKESGELLYIGSAANNLKKTLYRHYQQWYSDSFYNERFNFRHTVYAKDKTQVRVILTANKREAHRLEEYLLQKYKPTDNVQMKAAPLTGSELQQVEQVMNEVSILTPEEFFF